MGQYIYCIVKTNEKSPRALTDIIDQEVRFISYGDIAAVVSSTPVTNFNRLKKEKLAGYLAAHQKANEGVMKNHDVVPMAFGIIAPNIDEVLRILERAYLQFKTALSKIDGKVEFAVQAWWDSQKVLENLVSTNPEIQELREELQKSILGIPIKLKLGKLVQESVEAQRKAYVKDIHTYLKSSSYDSTFNKLINNKKLIGEEMIANLSFLIERAGESKFDKKMNELGRIYDGKLRFKYIGPMPPYSFTNINLSSGNFELVNEARTLLGLAKEATFDEIRKAYYALAHEYHPDKHPNSPEKVQDQMGKIAQAYNILENYCKSSDEFLGLGKIEGRKYSFKKEDVKNSIIIK